MIRNIFRWCCIIICSFFAVFGAIAYFFMDQKEGLFLLMLGTLMPLLYYGYIKEGSKGNVWMSNFSQSKNGKIIVAILFVVFILGKILRSFYR